MTLEMITSVTNLSSIASHSSLPLLLFLCNPTDLPEGPFTNPKRPGQCTSHVKTYPPRAAHRVVLAWRPQLRESSSRPILYHLYHPCYLDGTGNCSFIFKSDTQGKHLSQAEPDVWYSRCMLRLDQE